MAEYRITVLVENTAGGRGLLAEHGLSFLIELEGGRILFDTGQGLALPHNARRLGLDWGSIEAVVLSHGHYDHAGGLREVLASAAHPRLYAHPVAFAPKYACNADGSARAIGMPGLTEVDARSKADLVWTEAPMEVGGGLWLTGPIPRVHAYEDTGGPFFKDETCREPDPLWDDQAAFFETSSGTVVILGCAHAGVINTVHFIRSLTSHRPIRAVMGGMHLLSASPLRMQSTIDELRRLDIERLMPCHCTGSAAVARLWNEFPGRCEACPVGTRIEFP